MDPDLEILWERFLALDSVQRTNLSLSHPPAQNKVPSRSKCLRGTPPREWNHSTQDRDGRTVAVWCALTNNCEKCKKVALDY